MYYEIKRFREQEKFSIQIAQAFRLRIVKPSLEKIERENLSSDLVRQMLSGTLFGANVVYLETVDSTNRLAKELASSDAPEGTLVIAEKQTAGRGRMGRHWVSPANRAEADACRQAVPFHASARRWGG